MHGASFTSVCIIHSMLPQTSGWHQIDVYIYEHKNLN